MDTEALRELVEWSLDNPTPGLPYAGRRRIRERFNCSKTTAETAALAARTAVVGAGDGPVIVQPPAIQVAEFDVNNPMIRSAAVKGLRKGHMSIPGLAQALGCSPREAHSMIVSLDSAGYTVEEAAGQYRITGLLRPDTVPTFRGVRLDHASTRKFGLISDTHIASKYQRLDVAEWAYDEFERQGVSTVFHCGNIIDGYHERINGDSVFFRGITDQTLYLLDHYPQREGIATHFITGQCHEGWYAKPTGLEVGRYMHLEAQDHGRGDLVYLGHQERDVKLEWGAGGAIVRLFHSGGGSSYAMSYKPQKIVESYQGGEKPDVLLLGHFHKHGCFYPREVWSVLVPCCQDQTRYMRGKQIQAHVGFAILTIEQDDNGAVRTVTHQPYLAYDRDYHLDLGEFEDSLYAAFQKDMR